MAEVQRTKVTLRITGDDLDPAAVTRLLGVEPDAARRKGEAFHTPRGKPVTARTGSWRIGEDDPALSLDQKIKKILAFTTSDLAAWTMISKDLKAEFFCGVWLSEWNEGLSLEPETMRMLGERKIELDLDIYFESEVNDNAQG